MLPLALVILLASLSPSPSALTAPVPLAADWRREGLPVQTQQALRAAGYRLEDDGRVLDPRTKDPLTIEQFMLALSRLMVDAQRIALERLQLTLTSAHPDLSSARRFRNHLPEDLARALQANAPIADLGRMTDSGLGRLSAYFDGSNLSGIAPAASVSIDNSARGFGASSVDNRVSQLLQDAAVETIGQDPYGREFLSRFNGRNGSKQLPQMLIEDLGSGDAEYDYFRRTLVVDRAAVVASIASHVPPKQRPRLVQAISNQQSLLDYISTHPDALPAFVAENDATIVHELTHADQDRRDPVMSEMARDQLPRSILVEYEAEAWTIKNLYVASRLRNTPTVPVNELDLEDFKEMAANYARWVAALQNRYKEKFVNAIDIATARKIQDRRLAEIARNGGRFPIEERAALGRAAFDLTSLAHSEYARLADAEHAGESAAREAPALLARYYLISAQESRSSIQQAVWLQKSKDWSLRGPPP